MSRNSVFNYCVTLFCCLTLCVALILPIGAAEPATSTTTKLKIAYSDWPGWIAWDIAIRKGWFKEAGVDVEFKFMEYEASMEAFKAGKVDATCMTNGDAMVIGANGKPSKGIVINDY